MRPLTRALMRDWQAEASAPGKIVLTGEYAVLAGAPALVAAVCRRVTCRVAPRQAGGWRFACSGFSSDETFSKAAVLRAPPNTIAGVARQVVAAAQAPAHLAIAIDSSACYRNGQKLGVGSSAATVTALAGALLAARGETPTLPKLIELHTAFQGGGSGLDVAAAYTGGVIRFQRPRATPARLPDGVATAAVFCGEGTSTTGRLAAFDTWRKRGSTAALARLTDAAEAVFDNLSTAGRFAAAYGDYAEALARFDQAAALGVFGPRHRRAAQLARDAGVYYKPCGAGGNDIGLAVSADAAAMARFERRVRSAAQAGEGFEPVNLPFAGKGVDARSR